MNMPETNTVADRPYDDDDTMEDYEIVYLLTILLYLMAHNSELKVLGFV